MAMPHTSLVIVLVERRQKMKEFQHKAGTDPSETKYYMGECNFDLTAALAKYQEDLAWEKSHSESSQRTISPQGA